MDHKKWITVIVIIGIGINLIFRWEVYFKKPDGNKEAYADHPNYELVGEQNGYEDWGDRHIFGLRVKLTAKKDSLPPFYLMTCNWGGENAITNDPDFILSVACDLNYLTQEQLKKGECMQLSTYAGGKKGILGNGPFKLRVALVLIDTIQLNYRDSIGQSKPFDLYIDSLQQLPSNQVWSDEILFSITDAEIEPWRGHGLCE